MEQHKHQFYALWNAVGRIPNDDFDVSTMDEEDLVLAEAMVGEGLNRLIELKTRIENAKFKLQSSDLQRGNVPQAEEGKEGLSVEANTDKEENARYLEAIMQVKERNKPTFPNINRDAESFIIQKEAYKAYFDQT